MEIGDALKRFRTDLNLSQRQVTERIGMAAPQQWQKYEYKQMIPSAELVKKIAAEFNVSADYLLGLTDEPRPMPPKAEDEELIDAIVVLHGVIKNALKKRGFEI